MLAILNSCSLLGADAYMVHVEVDVSKGMPAFEIVGLPDAAVRESRERVRTALKNSGLEFPFQRITVNLAPADVKKEGVNLDFAIAVGILLATGQLAADERLAKTVFLGELSLDGRLRHVNGVLPISRILPDMGIERLLVPMSNAEEGALLGQTEVFGLADLRQFVDFWQGNLHIEPTHVDVEAILRSAVHDDTAGVDMADIKGQQAVKRAMEIAAAGRHNLLMVGSPGSGKTMLARRMPTILPDLTLAESLEITRIFSICGLLPEGQPLVTSRPFRAPHHTASPQSVIGGGRVPRPGEVSLAHHGVLFLDELPEFSRDVREALRQPLEDKIVTVSRVQGRMDYDASFQLIAAMNPCPCGYLGDPLKPCSCTPYQVSRYLGRVSGPLLDRIDMQVNVQRVSFADLSSDERPESSADIKRRVMAARKLQLDRFRDEKIFANADMSHSQLEKFCRLSPDANNLLAQVFRQLKLSARSHDRLLKVARTIADLAASSQIELAHVAEAVQYRGIEQFAEYK
ncbi:MAG: YifB family Mg chelatase-like AAA ATPase [Firmicutes bacterium]|nr:YifB family Mg chelatase-like AAA ATPase [Bacillota bacterium]